MKKEAKPSRLGTSKKNKKTTSAIHKKAAPQEKQFVTLDGRQIASILELAHELDSMADHVFYHHVTQDRNDFANWIHDVFEQKELAQELATHKSKDKNHITILRFIVRQHK